MRAIKLAACLMMILAAQQAQASIIVQTTDFISDGNRTNFNGFETIHTTGTFYSSATGPFVEDKIQVQQIHGDAGNDIWTTFNSWNGANGHVWYPNAGDHGYTQISMADGSSFQDVGFNYGTGGRPSGIMYELLQGGVTVLTGTATMTSGVNYLGFSGGGFDTIRVRDMVFARGGKVTDGSFQALSIDNIETHKDAPSLTAVTPEPSSLALLGMGLLGSTVASLRARRRKVA